MHTIESAQRIGFRHWIRTGRAPRVRAADGRKLKFNPYHDPRDGRFTFASLGGGVQASPTRGAGSGARASLTVPRPEPAMGRGGNIRAFDDPMTIEQVFPALRNSPASAIIAVTDNIVGIFSPATEFRAEDLLDQAKLLIADIRAIDPRAHFDELGAVDALRRPEYSIEGLTNQVNGLRFRRAVLLARVRGDYGSLLVETLRFVQQETDMAYEEGLALLKAGKLIPRLSAREALGNFIDKRVRMNLRKRFNGYAIDSAGAGPVRVNRREYDTSGTDRTHQIPDARVKNLAFDVTLTQKTLATAQIRGFFGADFRPSHVIIIRPSQLGKGHTYAINRPEAR